MCDTSEQNLIFVIEKILEDDKGISIRYMVEAAKLNEDLGTDLIDINFGCPVKKVVKGFAGSAVMKDEKLAKDIKVVYNN